MFEIIHNFADSIRNIYFDIMPLIFDIGTIFIFFITCLFVFCCFFYALLFAYCYCEDKFIEFRRKSDENKSEK